MVEKLRVLIAGAGPAGSSLAISLAQHGHEVCIVDRDSFPRHKLCGEFISPECTEHFRRLGALDSIIEAGAQEVTETRFYDTKGRVVVIPSGFLGRSAALSLSRAEMDHKLIEQAQVHGVEVLEDTRVTGLVQSQGKTVGLKLRHRGIDFERTADLIVDATGRAAMLSRLARKLDPLTSAPISVKRPRMIGFKAHLRNVKLEKGRCEIYSFQGGYGGLTSIENGLANHCFLVTAKIGREFSGDADRIVRERILRNKRASETLDGSMVISEWLAVSIDAYGMHGTQPPANILSVGDAAAFIDPFTGSGILMALESSALLSDCINHSGGGYEATAQRYYHLHRKKFRRRLSVSAALRSAAFVPGLASLVISGLSFGGGMGRLLARSTRDGGVP